MLAALVALYGDQSVMGLVGYAWAGFGAGFGPILLMAVFWKRMTWAGALAGMVAGAGTAVLWDVLDEAYFDTNLYAMVPAVALAFACALAFNPLGRVTERMEQDFEDMRHEVVTGEPPGDRESA